MLKLFSSRMRFCAPLVVAVLSAFLLFGNTALARQVDGGVETTVAGTKYRILRGYLEYPVSDDEYGFLIGAEFPDMSPSSRTTAGLGVRIQIEVIDAHVTTSVAFRFNAAKSNYGPLHYVGQEFGLRHYLGSTEGAAARVHVPPVYARDTYQHIFRDDLPVTKFLSCHGEKAVPYPHCSMTVRAGDLLYQVTFRKSLLAKWKAIQRGSIDLVNTFREAAEYG